LAPFVKVEQFSLPKKYQLSKKPFTFGRTKRRLSHAESKNTNSAFYPFQYKGAEKANLYYPLLPLPGAAPEIFHR